MHAQGQRQVLGISSIFQRVVGALNRLVEVSLIHGRLIFAAGCKLFGGWRPPFSRKGRTYSPGSRYGVQDV